MLRKYYKNNQNVDKGRRGGQPMWIIFKFYNIIITKSANMDNRPFHQTQLKHACHFQLLLWHVETTM